MQERTHVSWVHDSQDSDAQSPWESSAGLPCTLPTFSERSGQTSAPEATADSCTHTKVETEPGLLMCSWGCGPPHARPSRRATCSRGGQTDSSAPAQGPGP